MLLIAYSDETNPEFELVEVIVFVDKSMIGPFKFVAFTVMLDVPVAAEGVVVDVGEGELDDALYGNEAEKILHSLTWIE